MQRLDVLLRDGWGLVPVRLVLGYGFIAHGVAKLIRGPEHFADILAAIGVPQPALMAWLTTGVEILGGVALVLGVATALVSVPLAIILITAMLGVHWPYGFSTIKLKAFGAAGAEFGPPGYELDLVYIAGLVALATARPTPLSIDRWRQR